MRRIPRAADRPAAKLRPERRRRCADPGCRRTFSPDADSPDVCPRCTKLRLAQIYKDRAARSWLDAWRERLQRLREALRDSI